MPPRSLNTDVESIVGPAIPGDNISITPYQTGTPNQYWSNTEWPHYISTTDYISWPITDTVYIQQPINEVKPKAKEQAKMSPTTIIKNRAHIFRSFLSILEKNKDRFIKESGFDFPESDGESKKRCRFWAGHLFSPTEIYVKKILYITTLSNGENEMKWKDINAKHILTPIGIDIWGTVGGFAQKEEIDWGKALFYFIPSKSLFKYINEQTYPVCFTTSYAIEIPQQKMEKSEGSVQRMIDYDLE